MSHDNELKGLNSTKNKIVDMMGLNLVRKVRFFIHTASGDKVYAIAPAGARLDDSSWQLVRINDNCETFFPEVDGIEVSTDSFKATQAEIDTVIWSDL